MYTFLFDCCQRLLFCWYKLEMCAFILLLSTPVAGMVQLRVELQRVAFYLSTKWPQKQLVKQKKICRYNLVPFLVCILWPRR